METKPFGIDVVIVEPGGIKTNWGIIAAQHLKESSKGTDYEEEANRAAERMHKSYTSDRLSNPKLIAETIVKAVNSKQPKTRYLVGYGAKASVFFHMVLPTRLFDRVIKNVV